MTKRVGSPPCNQVRVLRHIFIRLLTSLHRETKEAVLPHGRRRSQMISRILPREAKSNPSLRMYSGRKKKKSGMMDCKNLSEINIGISASPCPVYLCW